MNFNEIVELIGNRSPLQKKRLHGYLSGRDRAFFEEAEEFAGRYTAFLDRRGISIDYAVDAYLKMCANMLRCQVEYLRTGSYPRVTAEQAKETIYESPTEMLSYMVALGISQFLWPTHYRMFSFFKQVIDRHAGSVSSYLEIGPGHGLFIEYALSRLRKLDNAVAIDISPISFDLSRAIIREFSPGQKEVAFILGDVTTTDFDRSFDFITMGEVLEHVNQPTVLLRKVKAMLAEEGKVFLSTCANCPAIDHVVQFTTVQEIRDMITNAGLTIADDLALPVEDMTVPQAESARVTINYCALLN